MMGFKLIKKLTFSLSILLFNVSLSYDAPAKKSRHYQYYGARSDQQSLEIDKFSGITPLHTLSCTVSSEVKYAVIKNQGGFAGNYMHIETSRGLENVVEMLQFTYIGHCRSTSMSHNVVSKMVNGENLLENRLEFQQKVYVVVDIPELDDKSRTRGEIFDSAFNKITTDTRPDEKKCNHLARATKEIPFQNEATSVCASAAEKRSGISIVCIYIIIFKCMVNRV